jgi:response regulator NasT
MNDTPARPGKGPILVVDDDRLVLATVTHGLSQAGYEVIDADNGDDAILLARQHRPLLALLDIRMEGKTGFDVAEYLRDVAGIPFMFLSAFDDAPTRAKVEALGAQAYLVKPLDVGQIVPTVDRVMAGLLGAPAPAPAVPSVPVVPSAPASTPAGTARAAHPAAGGDAAQPPADADADAAQPPADAALLALATGILMHRHTLARAAAAQRLQALALEKGTSALQQARRLVEAIEALAETDA